MSVTLLLTLLKQQCIEPEIDKWSTYYLCNSTYHVSVIIRLSDRGLQSQNKPLVTGKCQLNLSPPVEGQANA